MTKDFCRRGHSKLKPKNVTLQHLNGKVYRRCRTCASAYERNRYRCDPIYRDQKLARAQRLRRGEADPATA